MKKVWTGLESSGKSLQLSRQAEETFYRNKKWLKVTGIPRIMAFNSPMSKDFVRQIEEAGLIYLQYKNLDEILHLEECDIFMDELIKFFPQNGSNPLSQEQLHFLTQGSKLGINIYGASQDFSQVHKQFRLLVNEVYIVTKVIGSKRPMKSAPPVKRVWGICYMRQVDPGSFKGESVTMKTVGIPELFLIEKIDCDRFDTSYKIPQSKLPTKYLKRQEMVCIEDGEKVFEKTIFV